MAIRDRVEEAWPCWRRSPWRPVSVSPKSAAAGPKRPFPQHVAYVTGSIKPSHKPQSELDTKVKHFYGAWKAKFLRHGCGTGNYYVYLGPQSDIGEGIPISVSEAQSYGMLIVVHMAGHDTGAKRIFDGLYRFFKAHPSQHDPYLMAWRQLDDCRDSSDPNSATDGDLSIAHALLLAHAQWGSDKGINYRAEALNIINAIREHEVHPISDLPQLGDWVHPTYPTEYNAVRTSDVMPEHFREFWHASGKTVWKATLDESYALLDTLQRLHAPLTGLIPDFAVDTHTSPRPAPDGFKGEPRPGVYDYNACRAPWRLAVDYLLNGDLRAKRLVVRMEDWILRETGGDIYQLYAGYRLNGTPIVGYNYVCHTGAFGVGAMVDARYQSFLNRIWDDVAITFIDTPATITGRPCACSTCSSCPATGGRHRPDADSVRAKVRPPGR